MNVANMGLEEGMIGDEVMEMPIRPTEFEFQVSVLFPRTDIPLILERLLDARS